MKNLAGRQLLINVVVIAYHLLKRNVFELISPSEADNLSTNAFDTFVAYKQFHRVDVAISTVTGLLLLYSMLVGFMQGGKTKAANVFQSIVSLVLLVMLLLAAAFANVSRGMVG